MKVIWICNTAISVFAKELINDCKGCVGWLDNMYQNLAANSELEMVVCFPLSGEKRKAASRGNKCCTFPVKSAILYDKDTELFFRNLIHIENPDIIHIWGTESPHALAAVNAAWQCGKQNRVVINITGLVSVYASHYYASLPAEVIRGFTIRDVLKKDNLLLQKKKFEKRGILEIEAIRKVKHVIGRTDWDKACTSFMNPEAAYHVCNEVFGESFYGYEWNYEKCEKYSIFRGQGGYPIKGLHYLIEAMRLVVQKYPDAKLYLTEDPTHSKEGFKGRLRLSSYGRYIKKKITQYKLTKHVIFQGYLNEEDLRRAYLKANVFVLSSAIENSSSSLREAMALGVPCIASDVGGIKNLLIHDKEGILYQHDAAYMLAFYLCRLFEDFEYAKRLGKNARIRALADNDCKKNTDRTIEIYKEIINWDKTDGKKYDI